MEQQQKDQISNLKATGRLAMVGLLGNNPNATYEEMKQIVAFTESLITQTKIAFQQKETPVVGTQLPPLENLD